MKKLTVQNHHLFFASKGRCPAPNEIFTWSAAYSFINARDMARVAGCTVRQGDTAGQAVMVSTPFHEAVKYRLPFRLFLVHICPIGPLRFNFNSIRRPYLFGPGTVLVTK